MLDVMYFLMEEDVTPVSKEQYVARDTLRSRIYPKFLGRPYLFASDAAEDRAKDRTGGVGVIDPPVDTGPVPGAPIPVPAGARAPVPVAASASNKGWTPPKPRLVAPPAKRKVVRTEGGDKAHKPFIPPTDAEISANPFQPFRGLRETPMF